MRERGRRRVSQAWVRAAGAALGAWALYTAMSWLDTAGPVEIAAALAAGALLLACATLPGRG